MSNKSLSRDVYQSCEPLTSRYMSLCFAEGKTPVTKDERKMAFQTARQNDRHGC